MKNIEVIIKDVEKAMKCKCYLAGLALALTIPDICGQIEYKNSKFKPNQKYVKWFDKYIGQYERDDSYVKGEPYLCGYVCYQLRCNIFHFGCDDVKIHPSKDYPNAVCLDNFGLTVREDYENGVSDGGTAGFFIDENGQGVGDMEVSIPNLCMKLCELGKFFYKKHENEFPELQIRNLDGGLAKVRR
jgi:hypothetical protein